MIQIDIPMPKNCIDCDEQGIRYALDCKYLWSGCANCGRHPNCPIKEVPSGKWIEHNGRGLDWEFTKYECGLCHEWTEYATNYCPSCGAKMVEEQTGENK